MSEYPESEKFAEVRQQISDLMGFMEYLNEKGYELGRWRGSDIRLDPVNFSESIMESFAADFYGVDMAKVGSERSRMVRESQA